MTKTLPEEPSRKATMLATVIVMGGGGMLALRYRRLKVVRRSASLSTIAIRPLALLLTRMGVR
jgi:hypothetical protein